MHRDGRSRFTAVLLLWSASVWVMGCQDSTSASDAEERPAPAPVGERAVSCLGRIEPKHGIIHVSAPYFNGRPALVSDLRVDRGDWVERGAIIAVTNSWNTMQARVLQMEARVPVMQIELERIKEGPKAGDVAAQKAEIARLESELRIARAEYQRYRKLHEVRDVSDSELDFKRLSVETIEKRIDHATQQLDSLTEIRDVDVRLARSRLDAAIADVAQAKADLEMSVVKAPSAGRVLEIHAREGEEVGPQGILELARTDQLYVVAEVYETDITRIKVGQQATIRGDILATEVTGTVETIGQQIDRGEVLPADPIEFADARIVKVEILLHQGEAVAGLIHGRVAVTIHP